MSRMTELFYYFHDLVRDQGARCPGPSELIRWELATPTSLISHTSFRSGAEIIEIHAEQVTVRIWRTCGPLPETRFDSYPMIYAEEVPF